MSKMQKLRVKKNTNYTTIANYHLRDESLTWKAKGLLTYLLHLPDDWEIKITQLAKASKDKIDSVRSAISELEFFGYVKREFKGENVHSGYDYLVSEIPINDENKVSENPIVGIGKSNSKVSENPIVKVSENPILLNTNILNTKNKENSPDFSSENSSLNLIENLNFSILENSNVRYNVLAGLLHKGFRVSDEEYSAYVKDFIATLQVRNDLDKDKFDLKSHFGSWIEKQVKSDNGRPNGFSKDKSPIYKKFKPKK